MAFQYLTNVPLEQAREKYINTLRACGLRAQKEWADVPGAVGRVTAAAVYANICAPHYHASAMDGIALQASLTFGASETTPVTLTAEQYVTLDTGDPIPQNCDAVVMIEDVIQGEDDRVLLYSAAVPWQNIRQIGEDICAGEMILGEGMTITPAAVGAMLASGVCRVEVVKRPTVAIIPTGDEIVPPTTAPRSGDIMEFNSAIFSGMLRQWGAEPVVCPIVKDDFTLICNALRAASQQYDMVMINAGSSAGREDYSAQAIETVGEVLCHGIAIKPGKPAILGHREGKPIMGVPGYPVSGIIVIEQLLRPVIEEYYRVAPAEREQVQAVLSKRLISGLKYREFVRVRLGQVGDQMIATPLSRGSGVVSSFMKADGILEVPQEVEGYEAADTVTVRLLRPRHELAHTLVAIGSHDPLLDELANLLHKEHRDLFMSSSHVGSMGGVMAVRRGEAHIAGCHLLNEENGDYNVPFIKKYFPEGGVRLVECVKREQGLMLAKGNPFGLTSVKDLDNGALRYVNRQKGSGTRILFDYLLKQAHMDTAKVYGYEREEFTHTAVAAQVAAGSADAGMGIYSAAKMYDLSFIPVCREQYDLLIPDYAWDTPMVRMLLELMQSQAFYDTLTAMGGYGVDRPGRVRLRL